MSRWLNWTPGQPQIIYDPPKMEPTKPSKPSFDGFDGSVLGETQIIQAPNPSPAPCPAECPYHLPELASCGLQLRLEWPPRNNRDAHDEPSKPSKPSKLPEPPPEFCAGAIEGAVGRNTSLPTRRCRACNSFLFWISTYGMTICAVCHPPASPRLVRRWYWLEEGECKATQ
jgi:hypothetical protein